MTDPRFDIEQLVQAAATGLTNFFGGTFVYAVTENDRREYLIHANVTPVGAAVAALEQAGVPALLDHVTRLEAALTEISEQEPNGKSDFHRDQWGHDCTRGIICMNNPVVYRCPRHIARAALQGNQGTAPADFYEEDEDPAELARRFEAGEKGVTFKDCTVRPSTETP